MAAAANLAVPPRWDSFGLFDRARLALGVARSVRIYYGDRRRHRAMDRLYRCFLRPGDLAFDIGAHVGDRTACFRRLGCRVVAVEPHPALAAMLRWLHARHPNVSVIAAAVGANNGKLSLNVNLENPTVTTGSAGFVAAARSSPRWARERWTRRVTVPLTTLDSLIAQHGVPAFIKIDVEGFEAEALAGLTTPAPALSFEFTTLQRQVAQRALALCAALGRYRFNGVVGESQRFAFGRWRTDDQVAEWLAALPDEANSGDIYAALYPPSPESVGSAFAA